MTMAHRWLPGIAAAALLSVAVAVPAPPAAAARHLSAVIGASHPPGYTVVHAGPFNAPPSAFDSGASAACPAGTSALSGGAQDPDHVPLVQIAGSISQGPTAWAIQVNNDDQSVHQVNGYVICAA